MYRRFHVTNIDNCLYRHLLTRKQLFSGVGWSAGRSHPPIASGSGGSASSVRIGAINVRVVIGALNQISADVLAHCAPKDLQLSSGALSRVLLNDAGPGLQHELSSVARNGIDYGSVVTTQGHNLKCKYVLHGSLPKWGTSSPDPLKCLEQFVSGCLETANFNSMRSIAFPTLGIGALGYPTKAAVQGMVQSIKRFAHKHQAFLTDISIVVFSGSGDCATVQYVDVIVNSVGQDLAMTSGSCSAIVAAAGPNLAKELLQNNTSLPYGKVAVTKGYNLKCAEVFHGALLPWYSKGAGNTNQPDIVLEEFVYKCLEKAMSKGHKTIAFPALGAGNLKFPLNVAAACMVAGIVKFSKKYSIAEVRIVLYGGSPDLRQLEKEYKDEISHPGRKVNPVGHPVPHKQSHQNAEPLRGSQDWFSWKYREELRTPKYWTKYTYRNTLKDWNLDVRTHFHSLQPVDQVVSNSIAAALKSTMGMKTIKSIQRVENVDLFQKYAEECQRLFRKAYVEGNFVPLDKIKSSQGPVKVMKRLDPSMTQHTYPEINEYYFFHGTNAQHVDAICSQGLDSRLANSGRLGSGVYGAEVASKSASYVGPNSKGECPMFLIRMCLGDVYLTGQGGAFKRPPNKTNSSKGGGTQQDLYDSVVANGGSFSDREFVVYDRNQAYPEYLIWYNSANNSSEVMDDVTVTFWFSTLVSTFVTLSIKKLLVSFIDFAKAWSENATGKVVDFLINEGGKIDDTLPQPYADEMRGLAEATGIPLGEIVLYNIFYELFTVCTSIVAEDPSGKLFHVRNLDFGLFLGWDVKTKTWEITDALRPTVVNLDFQKGGKTVFKSVNFAGYIGILTAVKPGMFTLTMNERFNMDGGYIGVLEWILGIRTGKWMGFLTRETMEKAGSYQEAVALLSQTEMLAPAYFIVGGNKSGEGCVITRSREKAIDVWRMDQANNWYILETNYDHWENPLFLDDRRTPAHKCMQKTTSKNVSIKGLFNVLSSKPVLNKLTTYSALMQVNSGHLESWLQYCPDPCQPF
uniref:Acid ceramidase n=1 Tax=Magallana gigas TaxID=29159 RepID=K1RLU6_MAGGI